MNRTLKAVALLLLLLLTVSCQSGGGNIAVAPPAPTPAPPQTDVATLAEQIALPYEPESAIWQVEQMGTSGLGPTDFALTAILEYDEATIDALQAELADAEPLGERRVSDTFFQEWFPAAVRDSFSQEASGEWLLTVPQYAPDPFAKLSLINGYMFITADRRYVFVYLFTT